MTPRHPTPPGPSMQQYRSHSWQAVGVAGGPAGAEHRGWQGVALWVGLMAAMAVVGTLATSQAGSFYASLQRPTWAPPAWLFGPVWTAFYILMAGAAVLVHRRLRARPQALAALRLYALALLPNALWSWTFFRWHWGAAALAVIATLWLPLLATTLAFRRVRPASAALMVPVLLWVGFAGALNLALLRLNPGML